jgi:hypothetical protein
LNRFAAVTKLKFLSNEVELSSYYQCDIEK